MIMQLFIVTAYQPHSSLTTKITKFQQIFHSKHVGSVNLKQNISIRKSTNTKIVNQISNW